MSFFGLKSQIFLKNCEWGIVYFKLKGRKKKSWPRFSYSVKHDRLI